jgi:hypothetical protein
MPVFRDLGGRRRESHSIGTHGDDALTFEDALEDLDHRSIALPQSYLATRERLAAQRHIDDRKAGVIDDRRGRDCDPRVGRVGQDVNVREHPHTQASLGVVDGHIQRDGSGADVEHAAHRDHVLWPSLIDVIKPRYSKPDPLGFVEVLRVRLGHVDLEPESIQVDHVEHIGAALHVGPRHDVGLHDRPGEGGAYGYPLLVLRAAS